MPGGVIVGLERFEHFEGVSDRKTNSRSSVLMFITLSAAIFTMLTVANPGLEIAEGLGMELVAVVRGTGG
jgi:hypothetical protein